MKSVVSMGKICVAIQCESKRGDGHRFHAFPVDHKETCKKWEIATKLLNFKATKHDILCSDHFSPECYIFRGSNKLKENTVLDTFSFPETSSHAVIKSVKRAPPKRREEPPPKRSKVSSVEKVTPEKDIVQQLQEQLRSKDIKIEEQRSKIKFLQQKVRRKDVKLQSLSKVIGKLKEECLLKPKVSDVLGDAFSNLSSELILNHYKNQDRKNQGHRYDDDVKKFAMTLHFYGPKAYDYVRPILSLPDPRAIRYWTSSIDCDTGFFLDVFIHLKKLVGDDRVNKDCCFMFDGMSIKQSIIFRKDKGRFEGFVDLGEGIVKCDEDDDTVAKEALIFLVKAMRAQWKYPIGYVLIDKIDADTLSSLVTRALSLLFEHDMKVKTVTCDGTTTNIASMKNLGCKVGKTLESIDGSFVFEGNTVQFIPDPPHMLKLARNALGELKEMVDGSGGRIEWKFIELLHEEQIEEGIKFANKLSNAHIDFHRQKMKVRLAAQTLSSSVADAIDFLRASGHHAFKDSEATVRFIRIIDRLFDLLNGKNPHGKGFKAPLTLLNRPIWDSVITESIEYLAALKDEHGKLILTHRRKTFAVGLIMAATSTRKLANELLTRTINPYSYLLPYKFSQDHLELLNACIRGRNGDNSNPNVQQFRSALKKILQRASITASKYANCVSFEDDVSSPIFELKYTKNRSALQQKDEEPILEKDLLPDLSSDSGVSENKENILAYIAGFIIRILSKKIDCATCFEDMLAVDRKKRHLSFIAFKDKGGLIYPSDDVVKIVRVSEKYCKFLSCDADSNIKPSKNLRQKMSYSVLRELSTTRPGNVLFPNLLQHDIDTHVVGEDFHSTQIMKAVVNAYLDMRLLRFGQEYTRTVIRGKNEGKRQQLTKLIQFEGL